MDRRTMRSEKKYWRRRTMTTIATRKSVSTPRYANTPIKTKYITISKNNVTTIRRSNPRSWGHRTIAFISYFLYFMQKPFPFTEKREIVKCFFILACIHRPRSIINSYLECNAGIRSKHRTFNYLRHLTLHNSSRNPIRPKIKRA